MSESSLPQGAVHQAKGGGTSFWLMTDLHTFKVVGADTDGAFAVAELTADFALGPPPHIHHNADESFYILEGTFDFSLAVLQLWQKVNRRANFPRPLGNQLLRAATSVGANVEEGQGGQSRADFVSKYSIARKEAREARYWLRLLVASRLVDPTEGQPLIREADELVFILTAIIRKAKSI